MVMIVFFGGLIGLGVLVFASITGFIADDLWFLAIPLGIIWIIAFAIIKGRSDKKKVESYPVITETVTVISKFHEKDVDGVAGITTTTNSYALVFEFPDKRREKFPVSAEQYAFVREGETGILSYRNIENVYMHGDRVITPGTLFVDFKPQS